MGQRNRVIPLNPQSPVPRNVLAVMAPECSTSRLRSEWCVGGLSMQHQGLIIRFVFVLIGLYLLRGAPWLVKFAYPECQCSEKPAA